jgi:hypothetical protein
MARKAQESPVKPKKSKERPGCHESPEKARKNLERPGKVRESQKRRKACGGKNEPEEANRGRCVHERSQQWPRKERTI